MAKRIGTVIKFHSGVTRDEAIAALKSIKHLLDVPATVYDYKTKTNRQLLGKDMIHEYDDEYGGPVWYIP